MKKNKSIMIIGSIMIAVMSLLLVYVVLISTGVIVSKKYTIRIEAVDASKEYDGTPLTLSEYIVVEGQEILDKRHHEAFVNFAGNQIDVGTSQGEVLVSILDDSGADVTKKYNIEVVGGNITVTPRIIKMRTQSFSKEYDGTPLSIDAFGEDVYEQLTGSAVTGQTIKYVVSGSITEIGSTYIDVSMQITDKNNMPVNPNNYQIIYEDEESHGKITITPRYITVSNTDLVLTYDGESHGSGNITWDAYDTSIIPGDSVVYAKSVTEEVNAGTYVMDKVDIKVVNSRGEDVSSYYAADPLSHFGTLIINPIDVKLVTHAMSKEYDGKTLDPSDESNGLNYDIQGLIQMPAGDHPVVDFAYKPVDAVELENEAELKFFNAKGEDVSANYNIETEFGDLIISKRELTLKTGSATKLYNGEVLYGSQVLLENGENYEIESGGLAENHTLKLELNSKISDVSKVDNLISKYIILDENNKDVTSNYAVTKDEGFLEITKVFITITTEGKTWGYDGTEHKWEVANVEGDLPDGCSIDYHDFTTLSSATYDSETGEVYTVDNEVSYTIYDRNHNIIYDKARNITKNFEILSENWGQLKLTPLVMSITTHDKTITYSGEYCSNQIKEIEGIDTQNGHRVEVIWDNEIKDVQRDINNNVISVDNKPTIVIRDSKGRDITSNYAIEGTWGKLTVIPRDILVTTYDCVKTYDGTPLNITDEYYDITFNPVSGQHITEVYTIDNYTNVIMDGHNVGSMLNTISFEIVDENGVIVTSNYETSYLRKGTLKVNPLEVSVTTKSEDMFYDGEEHTFDEDYVVALDDKLKDIIGYTVSGFKSFKEVNTKGYTNDCQVEFYRFDNEDISMANNIKVDANFGTIIIRQQGIRVKTATVEKTYDGKALTNNEIEINEDDLALLEANGITYRKSEGTSITNVARKNNKTVTGVENKVELTFYKNDVDITKNINVIYDYGTLTILPIEITVQTEKTRNKEGKILFKVYDGTELSDSEIYLDPLYQDIIDRLGAHYMSESNAIVNVQKHAGNVVEVKNDVTIRILVDDTDITNNFNITYDTGYLRIDPLEVTGYTTETHLLDNYTLIHTYDNTQVSAGTLYFETSDLNKLSNLGITYTVTDYTRTTEVTWKNKNAVAIDNELSVKFTRDDVDVTDNILIDEKYGKILIKPIEITIYTAQTRVADNMTLSRPYNGDPLYDNEVYLTDSDWTKIHNISATCDVIVTDYARITKTGKIENDIKCKIVDSLTTYDHTDNFVLTMKTGKLEVTGLKINVTSGSGEYVYNGQAHSNDELIISIASANPNGYTVEAINKQVPTFTNVKTYDNNITYDLVVKKGDDIIDVEVEETYIKGKITINPATILIDLPGAKKQFDNTALTQTDWNYFVASQATTLASLGHTFTLNVTGTITMAGEVENSYTYSVTNESGDDITLYYNVVNRAVNTKLTVEPRTINVISDSASMIYDGTELTCHNLLQEPNLAQLTGFSFDTSFSGTQTEVGKSNNTFVVTIKDALDFTSEDKYAGCFDIKYTYGILEVLPYITGTGSLSSQTASADPEKNSFSIVSDKAGLIYLRDRSYGDYIGTGWEYGTPYIGDDNINPSMILSKVLEDNNYAVTGNVEINIDANLPYLIPYYSTYLYESVTTLDDTHISYAHGSGAYSIEYYRYQYNLENLSLIDTDYQEFEDDYYHYVLNTYLRISDAKKKELQKLGKDNGIEISDEKLVYTIACFVRDNFAYGANPGRLNQDDIVSYFISNPQGTCQDFASLATLMYRAYGIPARFVTGFLVNVDEGDVGSTINVKQTSAHAWVEVYIQGMGWVNVEVTNGLPMNISDGGATSDESSGSHESGDLSKSGSTPSNAEIMKVYSNKAGVTYLRAQSFGNYNGAGFDVVANEDKFTGAGFNPLNFPGYTLDAYNRSSISIDMTSKKYESYVIPYYTTSDLSAYDDVYIDGVYGKKYTIDYISKSINYSSYNVLTGEDAINELLYRAFVEDRYLSLDGASSDLLAYFAEIKASEGFNKSNPNIITDVATYIQNAATYKFMFAEIPNECTDVVYYFLHDSKEGVCQHYASAATLLYRYLGIPARYVTGVKCTVKQANVNTWMSVKDSSLHAWVEVYLNGLGWVPVEVTGFGGADGSGNGANEASDSLSAQIYPMPKKVKYQDGMEPVVIEDIYLSPALKLQGYYVVGTVEVVGDSTTLGWHTTKLTSYAIYDEFDEDVTGLFDITILNGTLQVYYAQITITTRSAEKYYDGEALTCEEIEDIDISKLRSGDVFNESNIVFLNPGQVEIGVSTNNFEYSNLIEDAYGNDVTDNYYIHKYAGTISVSARPLVVRAGSIIIDYDDFLDLAEDPFVYDEYEIVSGTLLPNHTITELIMNDDSYLSIDDDIYFVENIIDEVVIKDEFGNDVSMYYDLEILDGELMIN